MSGKSKEPLGKRFLGLGISDDRHRPFDSKTGVREARQTASSDSVMPPTDHKLKPEIKELAPSHPENAIQRANLANQIS